MNIDTADVRTTSVFERLAVVLVLQVIFFWAFHTYSGVLRYSSYIDATKLLFAVLANVIVLCVVNFLLNSTVGILLFHYYSIIAYGFSAFIFLFCLRLGVKMIFDFYTHNFDQIIPVMIYGTRSPGIGIAKMIRATQDSKYKLIGFIDDDENSNKREIMGLRVYHLNEKTVKDVIAKKAKAVIVSPLKMKKIDPNKDLDIFLENNISIYTIPLVSIWKGDEEPLSKEKLTRQIKSIQIEDLLERPEIKISTEHISEQINSKVILVTGAAGSIGSEIVRQMTQYNPLLIILLDQAESPIHDLKMELEQNYPNQNISVFLGDIRNKQRMEYMMDLYRPDFIYHAAAYKHVPLMEDNPIEAAQVNIMGTKTIADLAVKYSVKRFVMISSDKAVNPTNVMGASKRIAEIYVQSLFLKNKNSNKDVTKFITTRFGNVLGSNGSVIPYFKKQIEQGGPITVTHPEIIRYFMTIPEA
ncbi:MAG: SDR family NAD(P)-dependent oxidoreductase, partial [Prevotellaceae bacterium]|nr:SDR family NAD(P)-dependent oxidoreductase [Prevotellaceae bacterium]